MPNNTVSILDFGAIPGEDCTQAINDAIAYASANRSSIFVPDGTYYTQGEHNVRGLHIHGESILSRLKLFGSTVGDTNTAKSMFIDQYSSIAEFNNNWGNGGSLNLQNIHLEGNWDGVAAYPGSDGAMTFDDITALIKFYGAQQNHFRNVRLTNNYGLGYAAYMCGYSWFSAMWVMTHAMSGMHFETPDSNLGITSTSISDSRIGSCRGYNPAHIYGGSGLTIMNGFNVKVYNCTNEDLDFAFRLLGDGNLSNYFVGNHAESVKNVHGCFDFTGGGDDTYLVNNIFADAVANPDKVRINATQFTKTTAIGNYGLNNTGSAPTGDTYEFNVMDSISGESPKTSILRTGRLSPGLYHVNAQITAVHANGSGTTEGPFTFVFSRAGVNEDGSQITEQELDYLGFNDYGIMEIRNDEQRENQIRLAKFSISGYLRVNGNQYIYLRGGPQSITNTLYGSIKTDCYLHKVDSYPVLANVSRMNELLPLDFDKQVAIMRTETYPDGYENEDEYGIT